MAGIAYEGNMDLGFNTDELRKNGKRYGEIANELRSMATKLDNCILALKDDGWTTPAGTAFYDMTEVNWKENIDKYAALLDTLSEAIDYAASQYDDLVVNHIERTKL